MPSYIIHYMKDYFHIICGYILLNTYLNDFCYLHGWKRLKLFIKSDLYKLQLIVNNTNPWENNINEIMAVGY